MTKSSSSSVKLTSDLSANGALNQSSKLPFELKTAGRIKFNRDHNSVKLF